MSYIGQAEPLVDRFWRHVDKSGDCWVWTGYCQRAGYGVLTLGSRRDDSRRTALAHRVSFELANGSIPAGFAVCHRCDNPPCVRLDHLFLGTMFDNVHDMIDKARDRKANGNTHPVARLTADAVRTIRTSRGTVTQPELAQQFGVSLGAVEDVLGGRTWRWVP